MSESEDIGESGYTVSNWAGDCLHYESDDPPVHLKRSAKQRRRDGWPLTAPVRVGARVGIELHVSPGVSVVEISVDEVNGDWAAVTVTQRHGERE